VDDAIEIELGATADLGSAPPHEALRIPTASASTTSTANDLGDLNDIDYS
jgi:hypothetical protein